jgi:hypothetical protein
MYTEKEKAIARQIIENKDICALLEKVFIHREETLNLEMVAQKTNEELGEIVRANAMADQKILLRWRELHHTGQPEMTSTENTVPE